MNWETIAIYKMSKENDKVIFQKNADSRYLITDQKINKTWLANTKQARNIWTEYQGKGYKKV